MHTTSSIQAAFAALAGRARIACERGQGTVEYVALILLVGGILAATVALTSGFRGGDLRDAVGNQITKAINTVGGKAATNAGGTSTN